MPKSINWDCCADYLFLRLKQIPTLRKTIFENRVYKT